MNGYEKEKGARSLSGSFMRDYLAASVPSILLLALIVVVGFRTGTGFFMELIGSAAHDLNEYAGQHFKILGERFVRTKARDVAKQVEIYLKSHPDVSIRRLQSDEAFKRIAIQPVGKSGYTCLYEAKTGIMRIHPNPSLTDYSMDRLSKKIPSWWVIFKKSLSGIEVSGYYDWLEPDEKIREKYMTMTRVGVTLQDTTLMIAATTYIDEFSAPVAAMHAKADDIQSRSQEFVFRQSVIFGAFGVLVILFVLTTALWLARRAKSRYILPVEQLAAVASELGRGKWDTAIQVTLSDRNDEIGVLALEVRHMASQLRRLFTDQENHMKKLVCAEALASENETKFKSIFEKSHDTIMLLNEHGFFDCNNRTLEMFGFVSKEEFTFVHPADISPPYQPNGQDSESAANERIRTAIEEGRHYFEWMHRRKNGECFPAEVLLSSYEIGGEQIVQATVRDISKRKQAEAELNDHHEHLEEMVEIRTRELIAANAKLLERENRYRSVMNATPDPIVVYDTDGRVEYLNPAFTQIFGWKLEELLGKRIDFVPEENMPETLDAIKRIFAGETVESMESRRFDREGNVLQIQLSASTFNDPQGDPTGIVVILRDVSEKWELEQSLRESERKLSNIIDFLPDATIVINKEGKVIAWNRAIEKMTGIEADDMIGKGDYEYAIPFYGKRRKMLIDLTAVSDDEFEKKYPKLVSRDGVLTAEAYLPNLHDGEAYLSLAASALYDSDGNVSGAIEVIRDITDRKKAEDELKKTLAQVKEANDKIMSSLNYAKIIQRSLLANLDVVKTYLPDSFFIWEPRDIVGGDIFFAHSFEDGFIVAVIDCTGHGVPGAFMTMIAISAMNRIVKDEGCHDPADILKRLNFIVKTTLQQDKEYTFSDDGMDAGIVKVTRENTESHAIGFQASELTFSGASMPLYYALNSETTIIKGDRQSIGYRRSDPDFSFTGHTIKIEKGMSFYMTSDGFTDQLGGEKIFPFGKKRLKKLLDQIGNEPFPRRREILLEAFEEYHGEYERVDDVTVVGFCL